MDFSSTSQTRLAAVSETEWGVTPASPAWKILRVTGESLKANRETVTSSELRMDRNVTDIVQVSGGAVGGLKFEMTYGTWDDILESLMHSSWNANVVKNGVARKSFTLEKRFTVGDTSYEYFRFPGMIADKMTLSCKAKSIITGEFSFVGKGGALAQAEIASSAYEAANTNDVMNAASFFPSLVISGVASPSIAGIDLTVANNLRAVNVVGTVDSAGVGPGRFEVTGTLDAYFTDHTLFGLYLTGTAASLSFTIGATTGQKYTFSVPKIKFESGEVMAEGNDGDLMAKMTFRGLFDPARSASLEITRGVA